jgi:RND family efflux transporter MFP subunit
MSGKGRKKLIRTILFLLAATVVLAAGTAGLYFLFAGTAHGATAGEAGPEAAGSESSPATGDSEEAAEEDEAVPVRVVEVETGTISTWISATANLVPESEVKVLAEAEGRVTGLNVEEGDRVSEGQLLASVDREEAEILYNKARLKAENARAAYQRSVKMADEDLISREEFDKVTTDHEIAQQELAESEWRLERTGVRAPFTGRITGRTVTPGQHVRPGEELFVVTDFDPLIARVYLPERDVLDLREGREVRITLEADNGVCFKGKIRQISPVVDTDTGTVKVTVEAIRPPAQVRPGGFVTIDILHETRSDAILLPRKAVVRELQKAHVFVTDEDAARRRPVELGLEEGDHLEVLSGVEPGEQVVIEGQGSLKDGAPVKVIRAVAKSEAPAGSAQL